MDEGFLNGVFRPLPVAQDERGDRIEAVAGGRRKRLEGPVITALRRFNDIALHRLLHRRRDRLAALSPYDGQPVISVQEWPFGVPPKAVDARVRARS